MLTPYLNRCFAGTAEAPPPPFPLSLLPSFQIRNPNYVLWLLRPAMSTSTTTTCSLVFIQSLSFILVPMLRMFFKNTMEQLCQILNTASGWSGQLHLHISNLDPDISISLLRTHFQQTGTIVNIKISPKEKCGSIQYAYRSFAIAAAKCYANACYNRQRFSLRVNGHTPTKQLPFSLSAFSHGIFVKGKSMASANPISSVDDDVFTGAQPEPPSSLPSTLSLHSPSLKLQSLSPEVNYDHMEKSDDEPDSKKARVESPTDDEYEYTLADAEADYYALFDMDFIDYD
ncbi:hypothetical protein RIF29_40870 [Crotalaria pallida]|uniref:RRM domain-containing protein n=1 Tax=Crotalaria pallida TaxID=3830 RepID=A0AAN9E3W4_CROPI